MLAPTTAMYPATISLTDVTSSLCIDVVDKTPSSQVFVRQPSYGGLQIIQLEEEPAPPPRLLPSSSSLASSESESASGRSYWSSSYYSESRCSDDDEDDEELEDGEELEEYCSSEEDMDDEEAMDVDGQKEVEMDSSRMKRILAWRADFYAQADASLSESSLLKRKFDEDEDEVSSQSSKRSRRSTSSSVSTSRSSLGMHACPACDTTFDTQHGLRQHGLDAAASTNDACCTAVEYEFE